MSEAVETEHSAHRDKLRLPTHTKPQELMERLHTEVLMVPKLGPHLIHGLVETLPKQSAHVVCLGAPSPPPSPLSRPPQSTPSHLLNTRQQQQQQQHQKDEHHLMSRALQTQQLPVVATDVVLVACMHSAARATAGVLRNSCTCAGLWILTHTNKAACVPVCAWTGTLHTCV
jgi:hypothetical protein